MDYRKLNALTVKNKYLISIIEDLLDELQGAKKYKFDLRSGYHEIRMHPPELAKIAFEYAPGDLFSNHRTKSYVIERTQNIVGRFARVHDGEISKYDCGASQQTPWVHCPKPCKQCDCPNSRGGRCSERITRNHKE
jgi:hypothetical protein